VGPLISDWQSDGPIGPIHSNPDDIVNGSAELTDLAADEGRRGLLQRMP
jgi:hypothetical protein